MRAGVVGSVVAVLLVACGSEAARPPIGAKAQKAAPEADAVPQRPANGGVLVRVTPASVEWAGRSLVPLAGGALPDDTPREAQLHPLQEALKAEVTGSKQTHLEIEADPGTPYRSLFEIIRAADRAGVESYSLRLTDSSTSTLALGLPDLLRGAAEPGSERDLAVAMSLEIDAGQLGLAVGGQTDRQPRVFTDAQLSELREAASGLVKANAGMHRVVVSARAGVPVSRLVSTIEALQGPDCLSGQAEACVVDEIELLGGGAHLYDPARHGVLATLAHAEDAWAGFDDPEIADSFGIGGLGLRGDGTSGARYGHPGQPALTVGTIGRGGGTPQGRGNYGAGLDPRVRMGKPTVEGKLPREVVRRVVRRHVNELRHCYGQRLAEQPELEGAVTISFVIAVSGRVSKAQVASSTLSDAGVGNCLVEAHQRWAFPAPEGGLVMVTYPYTFSPRRK